MSFRIVDFSPIQYPYGMPAVRQGKFLHLGDGEGELLVLSPYKLSEFHAQILERYCMLNGLEGGFIRRREIYEVVGNDLTVIGGGHWRLDENEFHLFGASMIYGKFEAQGLMEKVRNFPGFGKYRIVIE